MVLLGNLALTDKKRLFKAGAFKVFIDWGKQLLCEKKILRYNLYLLYSYF